jgi:hypothetical protein
MGSTAAIVAAPLPGTWSGCNQEALMKHDIGHVRRMAGNYGKPKLERLGSFRELTLAGGASFSDMWTTDSSDGCSMTSSSSYTCYK